MQSLVNGIVIIITTRCCSTWDIVLDRIGLPRTYPSKLSGQLSRPNSKRKDNVNARRVNPAGFLTKFSFALASGIVTRNPTLVPTIFKCPVTILPAPYERNTPKQFRQCRLAENCLRLLRI